MPKKKGGGHSFFGKNSYFGTGGHLDRQRRQRPVDKDTYGRGSQSGGYGRSSYALKSGTFDGFPSLSRRRDDGKIDIYYGPEPLVDLNDIKHGHAIIWKGRLIYKRLPGQENPVLDTGE